MAKTFKDNRFREKNKSKKQLNDKKERKEKRQIKNTLHTISNFEFEFDLADY